MICNVYVVVQGLAQQPVYSYEDLQLLQQRLPVVSIHDPYTPHTVIATQKTQVMCKDWILQCPHLPGFTVIATQKTQIMCEIWKDWILLCS